MDQIRAHITSAVNAKSIRRETRNNREVMVVPSVVARFDTVLNGIHYSREELEKSYTGLDRTPAPFGHPKVNGRYVDARDPEAINAHWSGAWNEKPRIDGDRIMADIIIDVERAGQHAEGQKFLKAVQNGDKINTSTGLYLERVPVQNKEYQYEGVNFAWNHNAILLDEAPAISVEEGVGLAVNGAQVDVLNANLDMEDPLDRAVTGMAWELVEAQEHERKRGLVESIAERLKTAVKSVLSSEPESEATGPTVNHQEEAGMSVTKEQFDALAAKVDKLVANAAQGDEKPVAEQVTEAVNAALKPIQDQLEANSKAEHAEAVKAVVDSEILDQETAEKLDVNALKALTEKLGKPGVATNARAAFKPGSKSATDKYTLPEGE